MKKSVTSQFTGPLFVRPISLARFFRRRARSAFLTSLAALLGVAAAMADCPEATYPSPGCFYEWISEGEVCEWMYFPPEEPGGCFTLNEMTCTYDPPPQPGMCYILGADGCWSLPVQPYECYVWNGMSCAWELPPSPGACYGIVDGCWALPAEPTDGLCYEFDPVYCIWGPPAKPGLCYYQDSYNCWHHYPDACENPWQSYDEGSCECKDICPSADGPPPGNLYDCHTWDYQVCEWVFTGPTCIFPMYLDGCECLPTPGYCHEPL